MNDQKQKVERLLSDVEVLSRPFDYKEIFGNTWEVRYGHCIECGEDVSIFHSENLGRLNVRECKPDCHEYNTHVPSRWYREGKIASDDMVAVSGLLRSLLTEKPS